MNERTDNRITILAGCLLVAMTLLVFHGVLRHGFIEYDDNIYITENPFVQAGLTPESIRWAFTTGVPGYAHPVTLIAYMVVCEFFGPNAGALHAASLLTHTVNVVLLFGLLMWMTGATGRSAFVAALFAIHPLHVESVAWIAELKDPLSTTFWILTVWTYAIYTRRERRATYWLAVAVYAVGLMAKPMIVTLPFLLFLIDYWPLRRSRRLSALIAEKIPLIVLSAVSCVITYLGNKNLGAIRSLEDVSFFDRVSNAIVVYVTYLVKMVWPSGLAVYYPIEPDQSLWRVAACALFLVVVSAWTVCARRQRPYLLVGWLWYLGILVPVMGLVQVGGQAMADRYTYLSLVGVFIMIVWSVPDSRGWRVAGALVLAVLMGLATVQVGYWRDSVSIFRHTLAGGGNMPIINYNLGVALAKEGRNHDAIAEYRESLRLSPDYVEAHSNLGDALCAIDDQAGAIREYREAIDLDPELAAPRGGLGVLLAMQGHVDEALPHLQKAVALKPRNIEYLCNFARALSDVKRFSEAAAQYRQALSLVDPATHPQLVAGIRARIEFCERRAEP